MSSVISTGIIFNGVKENEVKIKNLERLIQYLKNNGFSITEIYIYDDKNDITYNFEEHDDFYGLLIDYNEEDLRSILTNIKAIDTYFLSMIESFAEILNFDYAFVCNDGELEFSIKELQKIEDYKEMYYILSIKEDDEFKIYKGNWNIWGTPL
ncbi:Imm64 family immunity protein [Wukongibacter sp. M2B1]|uniref:Imm64 family immunity protein n=1 Tax=Wukongibacter sp. M2B1 TaxID=3088895 RepID=UPI003D7B36B5